MSSTRVPSLPLQMQYLDDASDVHLGDHLGGVEEHEQRVQREGHVLQRRVMLERLGGVHTHGDDADDGAGPQQSVHPLQERRRKMCQLGQRRLKRIKEQVRVCGVLTGLLIQKMSALSARVSSGPKSVMGWASTRELCFLFSMLGLAVLYREWI